MAFAQPRKQAELDIKDIGRTFSRESVLLVYGDLNRLKKEYGGQYRTMKDADFDALRKARIREQAGLLSLHAYQIDAALDKYGKKNHKDADAVRYNVLLALDNSLVRKEIERIGGQDKNAKGTFGLDAHYHPIKTTLGVAIVIGTGGLALLLACGGEAAQQQAPDARQTQAPDTGQQRAPDTTPKQVPDAGQQQAPDGGAQQTQDAGAQQSPDAGPVINPAVKYWWPGFLMQNGQLAPIYMGFGDDTFYDKNDLYPSRDSIPADAVQTMQTQIDGMLGYSSTFFIDKKLPALLDGRIIMRYPSAAQIAGGVGATNPVMVVDGNGTELPQFAGGADVAMYTKQTNPAVLFHEFLHLAFDKLGASDVETFKQQALAFFNAYDDKPETYRLYPLLLNGGVTYHQMFSLQSALNYWAENNLGDLKPADRQNVITGLLQYITIHASTIGRQTDKMTPEQRTGFLYYEAFAYMGAYYPALDAIVQGQAVPYEDRHVPAHMGWIYAKAGLKDDPFSITLANTGGGFFVSDDKFKEFVPYVKSFVDWMLNLYPELKTASQ
jgi:hypothetical protein